MKIVLLRHGMPDISTHKRIRANEIPAWIEKYNAAGLISSHRPTSEAIKVANQCNVVVCSDLRRSIESAHTLGLQDIHYIETIFREMNLPYSIFHSPKLPPVLWLVFFRILWSFGYSSNGESLREAKLRASNCASRLKEIAHTNESVIFVGHGFVNRYIAKELLHNGWQGPASPGLRYWDFGVYTFPK